MFCPSICEFIQIGQYLKWILLSWQKLALQGSKGIDSACIETQRVSLYVYVRIIAFFFLGK